MHNRNICRLSTEMVTNLHNDTARKWPQSNISLQQASAVYKQPKATVSLPIKYIYMPTYKSCCYTWNIFFMIMSIVSIVILYSVKSMVHESHVLIWSSLSQTHTLEDCLMRMVKELIIDEQQGRTIPTASLSLCFCKLDSNSCIHLKIMNRHERHISRV